MTVGMTKRQADLLRFIESCGSLSPSFKEMCAAIGVASKNTIHYTLAALEQRGCIRRLRNRARAIEVLRPAPPVPPVSRVVWIPCRGRININEYPVRS